MNAHAGLAGVASGDYMGDHWLATFALMMLECAEAYDLGTTSAIRRNDV